MSKLKSIPFVAAAAVGALVLCSPAGAQMFPVSATGWNRDIVVEATATSPYAPMFAAAFNVPNGYSWYETTLPGSTKGLPAGGSFTSLFDGVTQVQFQPYSSPTNALFMDVTTPTGTLTIAPGYQAHYDTLAIFASSSNGGGLGTLVITFTDSTTSGAIQFNAQDWFNNTPTMNGGIALMNLGRVSLFDNAFDDGSIDNPRIYQTTIDMAGMGLNNRSIASIAFTAPPSTGAAQNTVIMAISGQPSSGVLGTCCASDGTCMMSASPVDCIAPNLFLGPATACVGVSCPSVVSACCNTTTGACTFVAGTTCGADSNNQGAGTSCSPNVCPAGACCNDTTGACTAGGSACPAGSTYHGAGSACSAVQCPSGACCNDTTGACTAGGSSCATGSTYQGAGTACSAIACPNNSCGSACGAGTVCASINGGFETGDFSGWTQFGDTNFTAVAGSFDGINPNGGSFQAYFGPSGGGIQQTVPAHAGDTVIVGFWYAALDTDNSFDANFGGQDLVSFLNDGAHTAYTQFSFTVTASADNPVLMFTFSNPPSYDFLDDVTVCIQSAATGVCCRGSTCNTTVTSSANCTVTAGSAAGAIFSSSGSTCNSGPVSNTPCCYADYNKVNGISVQDIFDFLGDWFAGRPYANVGGDGTGGTLAVQNIFDFLNDWFAGGC